MYNPQQFAETRADVLHAFIREHPLGMLVTSGAAGLEASHVPMVLDAEAGVLRCHLARANPQWQAVASAPVLIVFRGPEHYITPSWYPSKQEHGKVVPTWNYVAVHVWGEARTFETQEELLPHLKELTRQNESAFAEPWAVEDAPESYIQALTKAIVGVEISIRRMEGKRKASQNRPLGDRFGVIEGLESIGSAESLEMAQIVKDSLPPE